MSYLQSLRERRRTPQAAWHKLRTSIGTGKFEFFAAFEGEEDEEFYSRFFDVELSGVPFRPIVCDGKGGVLGLHAQMIETFGDTRNVFFFIDADHDRYVGLEQPKDGVFTTPGYAIENYVLNRPAIIILLKKHFQLNEADPILSEIISRVDEDLSLFIKYARPIMAYAICLRVNDHEVDLDKLHFSDFFHFKETRLERNPVDCEACLRKLGINVKLRYSDVSTILRRIKNDAIESIVRGKLVSQFMISLFKQISRDYSGKPKLNGKPFSVKIEINSKNLMIQFAEVMNTPQDVVEKISAIRLAIGR